MKYLSGKPFSIGGHTAAYDQGWERIFGKNRQAKPEETKPAPVEIVKFEPRKLSPVCARNLHGGCSGKHGNPPRVCDCKCHDWTEGL